ncbi:hypothetical protein PENSPDRAFT_164737 [Peniophora sp. CONT]|nr:hypothetical protein PENSPDRAFT_164737 [Peniophora sp. CONT]
MQRSEPISERHETDASLAEVALRPAASFWTQTFGRRASSLAAAQASSLATSDVIVQAWEEEIASLSNFKLAAANRQRNACSRTCIIPAEILS